MPRIKITSVKKELQKASKKILREIFAEFMSIKEPSLYDVFKALAYVETAYDFGAISETVRNTYHNKIYNRF